MSGIQRKRNSPQERDQFLELWKSSGLSQLAFSRQNQIPAPLFYSGIYKSKMKKLKLKLLPVEAQANLPVSTNLDSVQILLPSGITCQFSGSSEKLIPYINGYEQCDSLLSNHRSG